MIRTAFFIALLLLPNLALAQTFNVSTTAQLRTAFENAAVNGEDDTIVLAAVISRYPVACYRVLHWH